MEYIKKLMSSWEIKYGQIALTGQNYYNAEKIFERYMGAYFSIQTSKGEFTNKHFLHDRDRYLLRLSCKPFFGELKEGDAIYLYPLSEYKIGISSTEPNKDKSK